jgi:glycosyltransferase involved in cell wall biosynthesis
MNILFVHNNFPGQYRHLVRALARDPKVRMMAIGTTSACEMEGVKLLRYRLNGVDVSTSHPFSRRFDLECHRAEQVLYALSSLAASDFVPDVILAHPGWGETLPLRTIFPDARILLYCEFFYGMNGRDVGFDPEIPETGADGHVGLHIKNAATLLALADCNRGVAPTAWQRSTFPAEYQNKISVIHEGVDTDVVRPNPEAVIRCPSGRELRASDEVVTFAARSLEPVRGYHSFMRALPRIMTERPQAEIAIVGGDGISYGAAPPKGTTWKARYFKEVADRIDPQRIHFMGRLQYADYLKVLQVSSAHVYLTYPFVLSWSLLEALSACCLVVGSDTAPVCEVLNEENGMLVPFFEPDQIAEKVIEGLAFPRRFEPIRARARQTIVERYDLTRICLPKMMACIGDKAEQSCRRQPEGARQTIPGNLVEAER